MSNATDNIINLTINSRGDDILVGSGYCVLAIIDILLIIPCMIVFRDQELREKDSYTYMFHICIWDLVQAAMHLVGGIYTLLPISMDQVPLWLNGLTGGLVSTGWLAYVFLSTLLAINRFVHVAFPGRVKKIFSSQVTKTSILVSYVYAVIWMVVYLSPYVDFIYFKDTYLYYYDTSHGSETAHTVDEYLGRAMIILMGICYLGVICMLRSLRKKMTTDSAEQRKARSRELQITLQVSILFLFTFLLQGAWTIIPTVVENMTVWFNVALNTGWILINGANPVIYYALNPTIRQKARKLFGFNEKENATFGRTTTNAPRRQTLFTLTGSAKQSVNQQPSYPLVNRR